MTKVRRTQGSAVGLLLICHVTGDDFQSKYQESNDGLVDLSIRGSKAPSQALSASGDPIAPGDDWSCTSCQRTGTIQSSDMILFNTSLIYIRLPSGCNKCWGILLHHKVTSIRYIWRNQSNHNSPTSCSHSRSLSCAVHAPHAPSSLVPISLQELSWANVVRGQDLAQNSVQRWLQCRCEQLALLIFAGCQWVSSRIHAGWFVLESRDFHLQLSIINVDWSIAWQIKINQNYI